MRKNKKALKKQKILKNIYIFGLICSIIIINADSISAMPINPIVQYVIDNDTNDTSYGNSSYGSWSYITNSGLYNGDARIISSSPHNNCYQWIWPTYVKSEPIYATLSVYLNNANFTDPAAMYTLYESVGFVEHNVGTLNQKYAAAGWTSFSLVTLDYSSIDGYYRTYYAAVNTSGDSGQTGADAIRITLN